MTPTGVEHSLAIAASRFFFFVVPSMTPTGVEHATKEFHHVQKMPVVPSMTPTGVEHLTKIGAALLLLLWFLQ